MNSKEIDVYGTLVNRTTDPRDQHEDGNNGIHNGYIAYAYQLYDDQFSTPANINDVNNYQDVINKRLTKIEYDPSKNIDGDTYNYVTTIGGNTYIENLMGVALNDLDDVNATKTDGYVLIYNSTSGNWESVNPSTLISVSLALDDLTNVTISNNLDGGDVLMYDSTISKWVDHTLVPADVLPNGSPANPHLVWDSTNNTWVAGLISPSSPNGWEPPTATADGQVIKWDNTHNVWYAGTDNDHPTITSLTDTTINANNLASGQVLRWNGSQWVNGNDYSTLASLTDTNIPSSIDTGKVLKWNGSAWAPADDLNDGTGTVQHLDDIGDVNASNPGSGQVLTWDGTEWVAGDVSASCDCDMESLIARISRIESQYCTVTFLSDMNNPNSIISQIQIPKYSALYIAQFPNRVVGMMDTNSMQYKFGWVPVKFTRVINQQTQQEIWNGTQSGEPVLPADGESLSTDTSGTQYEATLFTEDVYLAFHVVMTGGGSGTTPSLTPSTISLTSGVSTAWVTDADSGGDLSEYQVSAADRTISWNGGSNIPLNIRFELEFRSGGSKLANSAIIASTNINQQQVDITPADLRWSYQIGTSDAGKNYELLVFSGIERKNGHLGFEDLAVRSDPQYQEMISMDSIPVKIIGSYNGSQVVSKQINIIVYRAYQDVATSQNAGQTVTGPWWG